MVDIPKKQVYLVGLLLSLLFFALTIFRQNLFWGSYVGVGAYMLCVIFGIVGFFYFISKIMGLKPAYLIGFLAVLEIFLAKSLHFAPNALKRIQDLGGGKKKELMLPLAQFANYYASVAYGSRFNVYQYDHGYYDSKLFYRLKPGSFVNENIEYSNPTLVNSNGYRDDEASLQKPEIILLGDSFSFGIGVNEPETYASLIEKNTGRKLLNTGVPSYATARESLVLDELDTSAAKLLLIQYCNNDLPENEAFNTASKDFIGSKEKFDAAFFSNLPKKYYLPLRYAHSFFERLLVLGMQKISKPQALAATNGKHGAAFVPILKKIRTKFSGPIVVFSLDITPDETVFNELKTSIEAEKLAGVYAVNVLKNLDPAPNDFYHFDGHINKNGHQKVANSIVQCIQANKLIP